MSHFQSYPRDALDLDLCAVFRQVVGVSSGPTVREPETIPSMTMNGGVEAVCTFLTVSRDTHSPFHEDRLRTRRHRQQLQPLRRDTA